MFDLQQRRDLNILCVLAEKNPARYGLRLISKICGVIAIIAGNLIDGRGNTLADGRGNRLSS